MWWLLARPAATSGFLRRARCLQSPGLRLKVEAFTITIIIISSTIIITITITIVIIISSTIMLLGMLCSLQGRGQGLSLCQGT